MGNQNKKRTWVKMSNIVKKLSLLAAIAVSSQGTTLPSEQIETEPVDSEPESVEELFDQFSKSAGYTIKSACELRTLKYPFRGVGSIFFAQRETSDKVTPVTTLWAAKFTGHDSLEELEIETGSMHRMTNAEDHVFTHGYIASAVSSQSGEFESKGSGVAVKMFPLLAGGYDKSLGYFAGQYVSLLSHQKTLA